LLQGVARFSPCLMSKFNFCKFFFWHVLLSMHLHTH
jgi:hypothetical protein